MISPKNFKQNLPGNMQVRVAFSESVRPGSGVILFRGEKEDVAVNL